MKRSSFQRSRLGPVRCPLPGLGERLLAGAASLWFRDQIDLGLKLSGVPAFWRLTGCFGEGVKVAVLDTGAALEHPDLKGAIVDAANFTGSPSVEDRAGHGTAVCGVIGARADDRGIVGVAPRCRLYVAKVLGDDGSGRYEWITRGLEWARRYRCDLVNLSLGGPVDHPVLKQEVRRCYEAGMILVAAAGNEGDENPNRPADYPARYPEVVSVGSVSFRKVKSGFSNLGADVVALGEGVYSLWPPRGYRRWWGTSFSTPIVTGILALGIEYVRKQRAKGLNVEGITPANVSEWLHKASLDLGPEGFDRFTGWGLLSAQKLASLVQPR